MAKKTKQLVVDGRRLEVSNLDKLLYPGEKFTKAKVIDYYVRISKYLLRHLKDHPVTLKRFPDGVFGEFFYEKDAPAFTRTDLRLLYAVASLKSSRAFRPKTVRLQISRNRSTRDAVKR